jgi:hypothetical protein
LPANFSSIENSIRRWSATDSGALQFPIFLQLPVDAPDGVDKPCWNCNDRLAINQPTTIRFRNASFPQAFPEQLARSQAAGIRSNRSIGRVRLTTFNVKGDQDEHLCGQFSVCDHR